MIFEIVSIGGAALFGLGAGFLIASKTKEDNMPKVKVLKLSFTYAGKVFVNMIEYEDKRSITYSYKTSNHINNDDDVDDLLKRNVTGIHNHLKLWLNFDINTYPEISDVHGASYV